MFNFLFWDILYGSAIDGMAAMFVVIGPAFGATSYLAASRKAH
jgi:hypothetical protein